MTTGNNVSEASRMVSHWKDEELATTTDKLINARNLGCTSYFHKTRLKMLTVVPRVKESKQKLYVLPAIC